MSFGKRGSVAATSTAYRPIQFAVSPAPARPAAPANVAVADALEVGPSPQSDVEFDTYAATKAANGLIVYLINAYTTPHGVHAETVIGALAALTGEFALRAAAEAAGIRLKGPGWVVGGAPDELLYAGATRGLPTVWSFVRQGALKAGVKAELLPDIDTIVARTAAAIGGAPFPPLTIPRDKYPQEWSPNACPTHRVAVLHFMGEHDVTEPAAIALALGIAMMLYVEQSKSTAPLTLIQLAAEIMIGVSRMQPSDQVIAA
jgi:hypothetical protein